ncbi:MAG: hypothetical protein HFJ48_05695 [Clostridia bacterium]|nr:hypothetical protein [Clostridia bacterium]
MKEIFLKVSTDANGKYVIEHAQMYFAQYTNEQIAPLICNINGHNVIKGLSISNSGLAVPIPD